jgi:drug/metabolite transporter (DMT)-like permease
MIKKKETRKKIKNNNIKSILFVITCTIFISVGQFFFKIATNNTKDSVTIYSIITNVPLIIGIVLYMIGMLFLIISLKYGELSFVYPFLALSFIWVSVISIIIFEEKIAIIHALGIIFIIIGVVLTGRGAKK